MSIEKITSKIISDAENAAKVTLDEAKAEGDAIIAKAEAEVAQILKQAEETGLAEKEKMVTRRKSVADIDGRKMILEEKQKLIQQCFDGAVQQIVSMDKKAYIDFLVHLVAKTGEKEGELILNEKDAAAIGTELVQAIAKADKDSKITLSKETKKIQGGFLLKNGSVYINGTIEALIDEAKEDLIGEAAGQLFQ